jgi:hypothetical protein
MKSEHLKWVLVRVVARRVGVPRLTRDSVPQTNTEEQGLSEPDGLGGSPLTARERTAAMAAARAIRPRP